MNPNHNIYNNFRHKMQGFIDIFCKGLNGLKKPVAFFDKYF